MSIDKTRDLPEPEPGQELDVQSFETEPAGDSGNQTNEPSDSTNVLTSPMKGPSQEPPEESRLRKTIGAFEVVGLLGKGGCGEVYRAYDRKLEREVAIKLVLSKFQGDALKHLLSEAKTVASLDSNPHIVPIYHYDVLHEPGEPHPIPYIVSKLIDGSDFRKRLVNSRPTTRQTLTIIRDIAEALHFAHSKGLIHRDIKPENILLDKKDHAYLADFGIAKKESDHSDRSTAGTIRYMSPEQARGEGHLLTFQSDIYSLGMVLYEALSCYPHRERGIGPLLKCVCKGQVESPRVFNPAVTIEQERVCMKALAPRASDRFATAKEFADELQWLLDHQFGSIVNRNKDSDVPVVPKGLRSFDANDSDFFLRLLPGPYDRDGVPESLRFWKNRIESSESTFRVGLVYGPSGCGKSSQMKAGLLPRLWEKSLVVYIEATPDETESRLEQGVKNRIPKAHGETLSELISNVRKDRLAGINGKLVLVIDQFEQWLVARDQYETEELTDALRQCDGESVQAILMVRDDFWLAVSRFLKCLDIPIVERENSALVDLFEIDHAEKVLGLFGQAYGRLDQDPTQWSQANREFIRNTVDGLARNRKIISVRLALFAEMMKGRQWVPESLDAVGGTDGVGITFLEETFNSPTAPAVYRGHAAAVQGLLGALLPDPGVEIKGIKKSYTSLAQASGYADQPGAFSELVTILHRDLKIITAVSEEKAELQGQELGSLPLGTGAGERSYQLTHDYLVRPLREWLTRKQKETRQGRAELMLQERVAIWRDKKENKQLPSLPETLSIYYYTRPSSWDTDERAMMGKSLRVHASIWGGALAAILVTLGSVLFYTLNEKSGQLVDNLVDSGQGASIAFNIRDLRGYPKWLVHRHLKRKADELKSKPNDDQKSLALRIAMDFFGLSNSLNDPSEKLVDLLNQTKSSDNDHSTEEVKASFKLLRNDSLNVILAIHNQPEQLKEAFEKLKPNAINTDAQRYIRWRKQARIAIASLILGNSQFAKELCDTKQSDLGPRSTFIDEFKNWQFERIATDFQVEQLMVGYGTQLTSLETLISVLGQDKSDNSIDLMSAICLGLGGIDKELFPADLSFLNPIRNKLYKEHRSALIHSSCQWLLDTWSIQPASEQASSEQASSNATPPQDAQWDDSLGMVFLRFEFPEMDKRILREMWIGATEIGHQIFEEYLDDLISDKQQIFQRNPRYLQIEQCKQWLLKKPNPIPMSRKPVPKLPWGNATYYDSLRFCNWLSLMYKLDPCYEFIEENTDAEDPDGQFEEWKEIQFNEDANGFRLLRKSEWEVICKGTTNTRFPMGSFMAKDEILEQYIYCTERYRREEPGRMGQTRPNQFGFFNLLGNTAEWIVSDQQTQETLSPFSGSLIGGSFGDRIDSLVAKFDPANGQWSPWEISSSSLWGQGINNKTRGLRIAVPKIPSKK
jgi:serine/threonine protein kinase